MDLMRPESGIGLNSRNLKERSPKLVSCPRDQIEALGVVFTRNLIRFDTIELSYDQDGVRIDGTNSL